MVAALENGYKVGYRETWSLVASEPALTCRKFLNFLNQAQTTSSREYPSVLSLLRSRLERRASLLPSKPRPTTAPGPDLVPLLTRVKPSAKGRSDALIYVPTVRPRPLEDLKGRRRVPIFVTESNGFPFLRVGKPNSPVLSRVLRQKSRKRSERATLRQQLRTEEIPFVAQEDAWEAALARLADEEGQAHILGTRSSGETYRQGTKDAIRHLEGVLDAEKADMIARGRALLNLVEAERELAGREKQEREERKVHRREAWEAKMAEAKKAS